MTTRQMIETSHSEYVKLFNVLEKNEFYWLMDNDYKRKYLIAKSGVTDVTSLARGNYSYCCSMLIFLLEAHNRQYRFDKVNITY